jgi:hypothetical protein
MEVACDINIPVSIESKQNYEMTKYPRLFDNTYWGTYEYNGDYFNSEIIDNRNNFVEEFNITKYGSNLPEYIYNQINPQYLFSKAFNNFNNSNEAKSLQVRNYFNDNNIRKKFHTDHIEYYQSNDFWIGIFSPYSMDDEDHIYALNFGYEPYNKLYSTATTTYIKKIPRCIKYKDTNKVFKNLWS